MQTESTLSDQATASRSSTCCAPLRCSASSSRIRSRASSRARRRPGLHAVQPSRSRGRAARTPADLRQVLHDLLVPVRPELRDPAAQCDAEGRGILGPVHLAPGGAGAHRPGAQRVLHRRHPHHLRDPGIAADSVPQAQDADTGHHRAGAGLQHPGPVAGHRAGQRGTRRRSSWRQARRSRRSSRKSRSGNSRSSNRAHWRSWCTSISPSGCSPRWPS